MVDYNALLKEALINYYSAEYDRYEHLTRDLPDHAFSAEFEKKIRHLSDLSEKKYVTVMNRRVRLAAAVAAAIAIILASAIATVAIVRPQIFFDIKERATHWLIEFRQEGVEDENQITVYYPLLPEDYYIVEEELDDEYYAEYSDGQGHWIVFNQFRPDGDRVGIDNSSEILETNIKGCKAVIERGEKNSTILIENKGYAFMIDGICEFEVIYSIAEDIASR